MLKITSAMSKRFLCCLMAVLTLCCMLPPRSLALETSATSAILIDAQTGAILYEKNPDAQMLIASTTKIMTALVALRDGNLADTVTVSRNAANVEGSSMYLKTGEQLSLETLLYGLLLSSGNDAATAISEHIAGSEAAFAVRMNALAQELGMTNSSFANPHGLDHKNHYSTARDMATLARAAMENETLRRMTSTRTITIGTRTMTNHNKLLSSLEGCIGLKTGYTRAAGRTLVTCVERDGHRLIAVTLQDGNDWVDHENLYEYGFSLYPAAPEPAPVKLLTAYGAYMGEAPVRGGKWDAVPMMAKADFSAPVPEGQEVSVRLDLAQLTAPVQAGDKAGEAVFTLPDGTILGSVELMCSESIPTKGSSSAMKTLKSGLPG